MFPEDEFRREIQRTLGAIKSIEEDPGELSEGNFSKTLFAKSPYAHPVTGTEQSLARLTRNDVASFHNTYIRPQPCNPCNRRMSLNEIKKDLIDRLETWSARDVPEVSYEQLSNSKDKTGLLTQYNQANVVLGNLGLPRKNLDFFPIAIMNYILGGGGFSSRLQQKRAKTWLAYSVNSAFDSRNSPGRFS